jgi:methylated-DNA-[protein]-cysteine S-methyltransferase
MDSSSASLVAEQVATPLGVMCLVRAGEVVVALSFDGYGKHVRAYLERHFPATEPEFDDNGSEPARRLAAYFEGDLAAIEAIETSPRGTPFQQQVWALLRTIPAGEVTTYSQLAQRLGNPLSTRAVGAANGRNPIAIIHPCHRVIGASNALTGYAGGLDRKRWLLDHERAHSLSPSGPLFA